MRASKILTYICGSLLCLNALATAQQQLDVRWSNERLSVRVSDAPLAAVIAEVARVAPIEVTGVEKLTGPVSADFADLTPGQALATLLEGVNYIIQAHPEARAGSAQFLVRVHSMSGATASRQPFTGRIFVAALDAVVAAEAQEAQDEREVELEDGLDDPDWDQDFRDEQSEADRLSVAGAFGPKADLASLIELADGPNEWIRLKAVKALGARPIESALPALVTALNDDAWAVRTLAVEILGAARDTQSWRVVGRRLEKEANTDFRIAALRVLALRGEPESINYLRPVLEDEDSRLREVAERMIVELERRARARKANAPR